MTMYELARVLNKYKIPVRRLAAFDENCFHILDKVTMKELMSAIENGVDPNGYHDGGVGENPLGSSCGECSCSSCTECPDVAKNVSLICAMFGINYKPLEEYEDENIDNLYIMRMHERELLKSSVNSVYSLQGYYDTDTITKE